MCACVWWQSKSVKVKLKWNNKRRRKNTACAILCRCDLWGIYWLRGCDTIANEEEDDADQIYCAFLPRYPTELNWEYFPASLAALSTNIQTASDGSGRVDDLCSMCSSLVRAPFHHTPHLTGYLESRKCVRARTLCMRQIHIMFYIVGISHKIHILENRIEYVPNDNFIVFNISAWAHTALLTQPL